MLKQLIVLVVVGLLVSLIPTESALKRVILIIVGIAALLVVLGSLSIHI